MKPSPLKGRGDLKWVEYVGTNAGHAGCVGATYRPFFSSVFICTTCLIEGGSNGTCLQTELNVSREKRLSLGVA